MSRVRFYDSGPSILADVSHSFTQTNVATISGRSSSGYLLPDVFAIQKLYRSSLYQVHSQSFSLRRGEGGIVVKVKCSRYRPGVAQRVGRGIALLFHDRDTRRG